MATAGVVPLTICLELRRLRVLPLSTHFILLRSLASVFCPRIQLLVTHMSKLGHFHLARH